MSTSSNTPTTSIGICGLGCVGDAMYQHFLKNTSLKPVGYDKFKKPFDSEAVFQSLLNTNIVFLCLPTLYSPEQHQYDKSAIFDVCERLHQGKYDGLVVLKSTVEPGTTNALSVKYPEMDFAHNPEFLTARTSFEDFTNQPHVVLGKTQFCDDVKFKSLCAFYEQYWPKSEYSICDAWESEMMKSGCNSFYSLKIAYFNYLYLLAKQYAQASGSDTNKTYQNVVTMMLKNGWINPMHTNVPGPDGRLGFGGACFPKDINALNQHVKAMGLPNDILEGAVKLNLSLRDDVPY
jgi:UDPglucose 6-dehydrogenase